MKINLYQIDAFTDQLFSGNPAAVCPLEEWIPDELMQSIAKENNLSETAFFVKEDDFFHLRWFTPEVEVDLCGHATLAAAYVLFNIMNINEEQIVFKSLSGKLEVKKESEFISLNFPSRKPQRVNITQEYLGCLNIKPTEVHLHTKLLFLLNSEEEVRHAIPNFDLIKNLNSDGLIITAKGDEVDFVSRYFAPHAGIQEDPVTGSSHSELTPFWAERLNKKKLTARQISERGGNLICEDLGGRVKLQGKAMLYSVGKIELPLFQ